MTESCSNIKLEQQPDFEMCMKRIYAWYDQEIIDRAPLRFSAHNAEYNEAKLLEGSSWASLKERWWDTDYQIELFEHQLKKSFYNAETFSIFWPNLGPEVYTAFYEVELQLSQLESFMTEVNPKRILLCIAAESEIQSEIIKKVERWK